MSTLTTVANLQRCLHSAAKEFLAEGRHNANAHLKFGVNWSFQSDPEPCLVIIVDQIGGSRWWEECGSFSLSKIQETWSLENTKSILDKFANWYNILQLDIEGFWEIIISVH